MKQNLLRTVALICASLFVATTAVACKPGSGVGGGENIIEKDKTQLYIGNYDGGYGHDWLDEYEKQFEELYKGRSFEEGKMGVDIQIINDKNSYFASNLLNTMDESNIDLIFTEDFPYYEFILNSTGNLLYDMTDWVTTKLDNENRSIADKLSDRQKDYYTSYDGKYYGLPHYQALRGLIYDVDLFNEKSLYIKGDGTVGGKSTDTDLSAGPDGQKGTYDDGLPATYDELWSWCDFVSTNKKVTPFCWTGEYKEAYSKYLEDALIVDTLGYDAGQFYYSPTETPVQVDLIRSFDSNGKPVITKESVSRDNSADLSLSAAGYYMLDFWKHIIDNNWFYKDSLNDLTSHDLIHEAYLRSRFDPSIQPIAFLIEGAWWENESSVQFDTVVKKYGDEAKRSNRTFGYLPLPKISEEYAGPMTLLDANNSILVANANIKGKPEEEIAKLFVRFISSDANIQLFNTMTGVARDYNVSLTPAQKATLSPFSKQLMEIRERATGVVYPRVNSNQDRVYIENPRNGVVMVDFRKTLPSGGETSLGMPLEVFGDKTKTMTAREYFEGVARRFIEDDED